MAPNKKERKPLSETRRMLLDFEIDEVGRQARSSKKVRKDLVKALSDASDIVKQRAVLASMELGDPTIVKDLVNSLKDENDDVRVAAAEVLAYYRQPLTIPNLLEGLKDKNTWVKSHCANGLAKIISGPIWARVQEEKIDTILADFPDMVEEEIRLFMTELKVRENYLDKFMRWRKENYEVEIDTSMIEELESKPLILDGAETISPVKPTPPSGISPEVEEILSELPPELRETLPEEDMRRLTPQTARELVNSLLASFAVVKEETPTKPIKKVKVKKVKKVKKKGPSKEELIERIPEEVRSQLPPEVLEDLSIEDLEALISSESEGTSELTSDIDDEGPHLESMEEIEPEEEKHPKPEKPKETKTKGLASDRLGMLTEKFGEEKAAILISIPEEMLGGIPDDQIKEMDVDSLKDLADALVPR